MSLLQDYLTLLRDTKGSDLHFVTGELPMIRVNGQLDPIKDSTILSEGDVYDMFIALYPEALSNIALQQAMELDFSHFDEDVGIGLRVNAYKSMGRRALALRRINTTAPSLGDLGLPSGVDRVLHAHQGMFIVAGPTGSGKSTTLTAIVNEINKNRKEHIISIEDPIEFRFTNEQSFITQRELGRDTPSFVSAIRAAMREDPDIVIVGEMRDKETVEAALALSETGHLVFTTLHTSGSVASLNRLIQFFPSESQEQTRVRLSDALLGVLSQRLVLNAQKTQRLALFELMYVNNAIRNLITVGDFIQIDNAIEVASKDGMLTFKSHIYSLLDQGVIDEATARLYLPHRT